MVQEQLTQSMNKSSRQAREITQRLNKLTEAQAVIGWTMIMLLVTILGVIYLNQSSQMATVGRRVQYLQYEVSVIQRENAGIEREIAQLQSLSRLQKDAEKLGFIPSTAYDMEYLRINNYPPLLPSNPLDLGQEEAAAPPVDTTREAIWLVFSAKINDLMLGESRE